MNRTNILNRTCKYCNEEERKQDKPGLVCDKCFFFVHLLCLKRQGTPGDFACDVFFDFTCEECSPSKKEVFTRNKFPWVNVILLTLHHLSTKSYGISNNGFFHYKTHICSFIDRNWLMLFEPNFRQKKNWVGTIAGALSVYSHLFFQSGSQVLGESGWWRLMHNFSPAVGAQIVQDFASYRLRGRMRNQMALDRNNFIEKVIEMGYKDLINEQPPVVPSVIPNKKRRMESLDDTSVFNASYNETHDSDSRLELPEDSQDVSMNALQLEASYSDMEHSYQGYSNIVPVAPSDTSSIHSYQKSAVYYDSDSRSGSPHFQTVDATSYHDDRIQNGPKVENKQKKKEKIVIRESLFSNELNSVDLPWIEKRKEEKDIVEMTPYQEIQLLKQVENLIPKVKDPNKKAYLHVLKAKLALRRLKRHKHLPLFDFDKTVKLLAGHATEDSKEVGNTERILDRFQRSYLMDNLCGTITNSQPSMTLLPHIEPTPFRSPYSGVTLKPYIRRDPAPDNTWLRLMDELLVKTNRHVKGYSPPPRCSLDFCYVRPQHIPAVNALCAQYFWPGIDLSEALEYPETSVVCVYGRLVVGCAFLVPNAGRDAYLSFILTRPEWRRRKLATFMLYHLLQTCTGKDVTLHCSPTNPAIFLYQKFGFKVEELVQDFYEKYFDIDYKGCRHALLLRLTR